jgi:hypothetical protein
VQEAGVVLVRRLLACVVPLTVLSIACASNGGSAPPAPSGNGVNDVRKACEVRAAWARATEASCLTCVGLATTPKCTCSDPAVSGKCVEQQQAKNAEPSCEGTADCTTRCARTDCACVEACYAGKACRPLAAAVDGCAASICDGQCR